MLICILFERFFPIVFVLELLYLVAVVDSNLFVPLVFGVLSDVLRLPVRKSTFSLVTHLLEKLIKFSSEDTVELNQLRIALRFELSNN